MILDTAEQRRFNDVELNAILLALHEAAHTVACIEFGIDFDFVKLVTSWWTGDLTEAGFVQVPDHLRGDADPDDVDREIVMMYAGLAAEEYWLGLHPGHGSVNQDNGGGDTRMAAELLKRYPNAAGESALRSRALGFVGKAWPRINTLADLLLVQHRVGASKAKRTAR